MPADYFLQVYTLYNHLSTKKVYMSARQWVHSSIVRIGLIQSGLNLVGELKFYKISNSESDFAIRFKYLFICNFRLIFQKCNFNSSVILL